MTNSLAQDVTLRTLLDRLHAQSEAQMPSLAQHIAEAGVKTVAGSDADVAADKPFWADKMVALDRDKAELCYRLCRATGARRIVEAGTSFGVSTLYLAAAVRDNGGGVVIGTEYEPAKAAKARAHFAEAGLAAFIDLREGDLRQTLMALDGPVDFLLVDIWIPMIVPALERVVPHMRTGAFIVADNTAAHREAYAPYFAYLAAHGFTTQTLPFDGGLEMSVKLT
jgi:predicted O-methyltransferase YrrM